MTAVQEFDPHRVRRALIQMARLLLYLEEWMILAGHLRPEKRTVITFPKDEAQTYKAE